MDRSPPGSTVCEILQARILEWVAMSSSRRSSRPMDGTHISCVSCTAGKFFPAESLNQDFSPYWKYLKIAMVLSSLFSLQILMGIYSAMCTRPWDMVVIIEMLQRTCCPEELRAICSLLRNLPRRAVMWPAMPMNAIQLSVGRVMLSWVILRWWMGGVELFPGW